MSRSHNFALLIAAAIIGLAGCSGDSDTPASPVARGNGVCLQTPEIDHTEIADDSTILFFLKGGKVWKNTLTFACPGLKLEDGFAYATDFPEICSNAQTIRVLRSGGLCELGQFTPYTPPKP